MRPYLGISLAARMAVVACETTTETRVDEALDRLGPHLAMSAGASTTDMDPGPGADSKAPAPA